MANPIVENIAKTNAEIAKSSRAAEAVMKGGAAALTESGNASRAALQELTKAYQELATKNAKNLTTAIQAISAVKSPTEFIELQQKLIKDGVEAAVSDSRLIAQLTTSVFTAAFAPVKKQFDSMQKTAQIERRGSLSSAAWRTAVVVRHGVPITNPGASDHSGPIEIGFAPSERLDRPN